MDAKAEAEFRDFVVSRTPRLLRTAYLLTGDRGTAEDAVQAAFAALFVSWARVRRRESLDAYVTTVLTREIGSWRRRRRVRTVPVADVPETPGPEASPSDDRDRLQRALLELPSRQRAVVVLRFYLDLSEADTAHVLGIGVGSVKQHTSRGLARLRRLLDATDLVEEA